MKAQETGSRAPGEREVLPHPHHLDTLIYPSCFG
jgi:hypothetical protein